MQRTHHAGMPRHGFWSPVFRPILAAIILLGLLAAAVGCATTAAPDPQQQAINAAYGSSVTLDGAVKATKAALDAGKLSPADAKKALEGFVAGQAGIKAGLAALSPASAPAPK